MALLTLQKLTAKYNLTEDQRAKIRKAVNSDQIRFKIVQEPIPKVTGMEDEVIGDTKIGVLKCEEKDVQDLLGL